MVARIEAAAILGNDSESVVRRDHGRSGDRPHTCSPNDRVGEVSVKDSHALRLHDTSQSRNQLQDESEEERAFRKISSAQAEAVDWNAVALESAGELTLLQAADNRSVVAVPHAGRERVHERLGAAILQPFDHMADDTLRLALWGHCQGGW
jgi:hypothetical protein